MHVRTGTSLISTIVLWFFVVMSLLPPGNARAFGLDDEKTLGRKVMEQIREQLPLIEDGEILTYVQSVGKRVARQIGATPYQFQFFIVDESVPNAFAVPGGYIFVNRGLIELMGSEGELASILSHELAHIEAQHIRRRLEQGKFFNIAAVAGMIAAAFLGLKGDASQAIASGTLAGARSLQLKYSRENEEEADQLGFRYLCAAGYDPENMVNAMERLSRAQWRSNARSTSYLSTHPAVGERIQYLEILAQQYHRTKSKPKGVEPAGDFAFMRAALVSEYEDPQVALKRFENEVREGIPAATYGLGRLYLRQGFVEKAVPHLQKSAREHPDSPMVLGTLGYAYFQQGRLQEARKTLQSALALDTSAFVVHFRLALLLQDLGDDAEALAHLQKIEEYAPALPEIDYHLGVILGRMGRLGPAHFHLGRYYLHKQEWKTALFHYEKAKDLYRSSPAREQEIDRELKEIGKKVRGASRATFR